MDVVEEIKQRLSIEDVVAQYVQLKRAGRNFKGLSPFTNEKSPSLMVSPEKQIWHDFSSGKGGNVFSFVMEMEGLDFKQALEMLARQAGIDPSQFQSSRNSEYTREKERLYELLDIAAKFYQVHLTKNDKVQEYVFKTRGFNKKTVLDFRIGYSPNNGSALVEFLKKKGFSDKQIKLGGLGVSRRGGLGDMFRGRLMIPLADPMGRVIGFTARDLDDDPTAPKYINTPQTILYDKSRHIFGLNLAKDAIRLKKYAVVVEGNLDVIASHQVGIRQVVATAGTAITEYHLKGISRFAGDIRLSFDQDDAGIRATERAIGLASKLGVNLSVITIPGAKDPDELIKQDPVSWKRVIESPEYGLDWLIGYYQKQINLSDGKGKREFSDLMLNVIKSLNDSVEREHYLIKVAEIMGVSIGALKSKIDSSPTTQKLKKSRTDPLPLDDPKNIEFKKLQDHLLCLVLVHPELRQFTSNFTPEMMADDLGKMFLEALIKNPDLNYNGLAKIDKIADYVKILQLQYEDLYEDLDVLEQHYEAARLQTRLLKTYVSQQKSRIALEMNNTDEKSTNSLLEEAKKLDLLLKTTSGSEE